MNVMGLFAGIGGIELGLQRAGMRVVGLVERDPWCREVLARHWPAAAIHDDVTTTVSWWSDAERPCVDIVAGGFPCQPFSQAGLQKGVEDERWMWPAMADVVRAVRPRYVVVENVSALVRDGWAWGAVLADLHALGFDAEWSTLSANQFGAPHVRERVYLVAYAACRDGAHPDESATPWPLELEPRGGSREHGRGSWVSEPALGRVAHGVPRRLVHDPLHALGNAVVPPRLRAHRTTYSRARRTGTGGRGMSDGPIKAWWRSFKPKQITTTDASRMCARSGDRGYCGRRIVKDKIADHWVQVSCTDCRAAFRADGGRIELIPGVHA